MPEVWALYAAVTAAVRDESRSLASFRRAARTASAALVRELRSDSEAWYRALTASSSDFWSALIARIVASISSMIGA